MTKVSKRGFDDNDKRWFSEKELIKLKRAKDEIEWLISRDYRMEHVIKFVGDRYQFSLRQRDALKRGACSEKSRALRISKKLKLESLSDGNINIDGFNLIIALEVALSGGTLIIGSDGCVRDLAGLRGTYKLIDKTYKVLDILGRFLNKYGCEKVTFYLDSPVSNSGNLRYEILEYAKEWGIDVEVNLVNNADVVLEKLERVVSTDAVIIDKAGSYFNLAREIISEFIEEAVLVDLN